MANSPPTSSPPPILRLVFALAALALLLAVVAWRAQPDGNLHVFFLDTPGDAVLIQTPRGRYALIDGGSDPATLALHLGQQMPFWQRTLAAVVLTQADHGRLPGQVAALRRYHTELALVSPHFVQQASRQANPQSEIQSLTTVWLQLVTEQGTAVHPVQPGLALNLDGAVLTVLAVGDDREAGLVLRLDHGVTSVVLDGAGGEIDEDALLAGAQPVTAVAYPWQREMNTPLLAAWQPQAIIFTTAYEADAPALLTLHERALNGAALYHPRLNGTTELVSNGQRAWIVTTR